jgi:hypothetical protein
MSVMVFLNDGHVIFPMFHFDQAAEVIGYYTTELWNSEIKGFRAVLDNGEVIELGQVA